jgi:hypothetical protein
MVFLQLNIPGSCTYTVRVETELHDTSSASIRTEHLYCHRCWLVGVVRHQGISVLRLSWEKCKCGGIYRGTVLGFDYYAVYVNGVRLCILTVATNRPIVHPPDDI